jgi:hypothetical protein
MVVGSENWQISGIGKAQSTNHRLEGGGYQEISYGMLIIGATSHVNCKLNRILK